MNDIVKKIQAGYDIIKDIDRWAQGYYQYDKNGEKCPWAEGYCFCALGVLVFVGDGHSHNARCAIQRISEELFGKSVQEVNDDETVSKEVAHRNVLKVYLMALDRWKDRDPEPWELIVEPYRTLCKEGKMDPQSCGLQGSLLSKG